ncbi:MAG: phosphatidate cytidylyltransferase [Actinomycetota bacterium]|nr:phosphatidate cytidylyltransferase [Actinomycetota bacterium]
MSTADQGPPTQDPPSTRQPLRAARAGRDLPMAIGVGVGLGVIIVAALLLYRPAFVVIVGAAVLASVWEMTTTLRASRKIEIGWLPVGVGSVAIVGLAWPFGHQAQAFGTALTALICLAWRFPRGADGYLRDISASVFLVVYLGLFASFATLLVQPHDGAQRALTFLIAVVCSDTGGYATGALLGKHPMAPRISPKKSWEGFLGSAIASMIGGALSVSLMLHHPWWQGAVIGAVLTVVAVVGDLAESLIKRDLGVKDMGHLLPGHGGIMDRMDSLLPSVVVAWGLLHLFVPAG